jgi:hypothetical protein
MQIEFSPAPNALVLFDLHVHGGLNAIRYGDLPK